MGITTFVYEGDLEERVVRLADEELTVFDAEILLREIDGAFYKPKDSKPETPEHLLIISSKAKKARAIINRQRIRDPTIKEYSYGTLKLYFMKNPNAEPRDILKIIKEEQRMRLANRSGVMIPGYSDYQAVVDAKYRNLGIAKRA